MTYLDTFLDPFQTLFRPIFRPFQGLIWDLFKPYYAIYLDQIWVHFWTHISTKTWRGDMLSPLHALVLFRLMYYLTLIHCIKPYLAFFCLMPFVFRLSWGLSYRRPCSGRSQLWNPLSGVGDGMLSTIPHRHRMGDRVTCIACCYALLYLVVYDLLQPMDFSLPATHVI